MADNLVFEDSVNSELTQSEFVDKQFLYVVDNNNGSYSGQITIDSTALSNSGNYLHWQEAFLEIPLVLQAETPAAGTALGLANSLDYMLGLQQTPFLNVFSSFKNLTSWSQDNLKSWGAITGFYPDSAESWLYNPNTTAASVVNLLNTGGQGFCNNRNAPYVVPSSFGIWSGSFTAPTTGTAVSAIVTTSGRFQLGMMVIGAGLTAGTYITAVTVDATTSLVTGATLSVAPTTALAGVTNVFGISPVLPVNTSTQATNVSDNLRSTYNEGFLKRQNWINYSLSTWADGLTTSTTNNQLSLLANNEAGYKSTFTNYIQRSSTSRAIIIDAIVRLKDICDFFNKVPLLKGSTIRLYINTNQVYFTLGLVAPVIAGTTGTTGSTMAQSQSGCIALTSSPTVLGGGATNPVMVASVDFGQGSSQAVQPLQGTPATPQSISVSLSIVKTQFSQMANSYTAPISAVRLYCPAYVMSPIAEQRYLSLTPTKKVVYNDIFYYSYQNLTASSTFNVLVSNGLPNIRSVTALFTLPKTSNGTASTYASTTALAGVTSSTLLSPFATTGGTPDPIDVTQFQIQISGKNLFINNLQYDFEQFYEQLSASNQLNGNLTTSLGSGLIGKEEFQQLYRYYYGAVRSVPQEDGVAKAVQISGTINSSVNCDMIVFVEFERSIVIDCRSGQRIA